MFNGAISITDVDEGSSAQAKGVLPGSRLLRINGEGVAGMAHAQATKLLQAVPAGKTVRLSIQLPDRGSLAPESPRDATDITFSQEGPLGIWVTEAPDRRSIVIAEVDAKSQAHRRGVRPGSVLRKVNGQNVSMKSLAATKALIAAAGRPLRLLIEPPDQLWV